jgi:hypothetical protein
VAEFEREAAVLQLLLETLNSAESEAKSRYLAPVVSRVQPYLRMLLPGADIVLDESLHIAALQRDGRQEDFDILEQFPLFVNRGDSLEGANKILWPPQLGRLRWPIRTIFGFE